MRLSLVFVKRLDIECHTHLCSASQQHIAISNDDYLRIQGFVCEQDTQVGTYACGLASGDGNAG